MMKWTYEDYRAGIEYVKRHAPNHHLLPDIEKKFSVVTCAYLQRAMDSIPPPQPVAKKQTEYIGDPQFDALIIQRKKLFTERAKLSNLFHKMAHRIDRVNNSKKIQAIQTEIHRIGITIQYFREHGEMPLHSNPYELDTQNPLALDKFYRHSMSSRSRLRNQLEKLAVDPVKNATKIAAKESKLLEYEQKIEYCKNAFKQTRII